ncbi:hypothetical protein pipiens_010546 [Culex pipiens pipiens]|uniref:Uncharacterized protein n=1 Tax=Culex pipiens pipiens TaxID=38569 RepID=A0ABD1D9Q8_CULPP
MCRLLKLNSVKPRKIVVCDGAVYVRETRPIAVRFETAGKISKLAGNSGRGLWQLKQEAMENAAMVEENGTGGGPLGDQMNQSQDPHNNSSSSSGGPPGHPVSRGPPNGSSSSSSTGPSSSESAAAAAAAANIVQILPASHTSGSVQVSGPRGCQIR